MRTTIPLALGGPYEVVARHWSARYLSPIDGDPIAVVAELWMATQFAALLNNLCGPYTRFVPRRCMRQDVIGHMAEYFDRYERPR